MKQLFGMFNAMGSVVVAQVTAGERPAVAEQTVTDQWIASNHTRYHANRDDGASYMLDVGAHIGASWVQSGRSVIEPGHRLTAALAATRVPGEYLDTLILPWKTFGIRLPADVLTDQTCEIIVHQGTNGITVISEHSYGISNGTYPTLAMFNIDEKLTGEWWDSGVDKSAADRFIKMLHWTLLGVCVEITNYRESNAVSKRANLRRKSKYPDNYNTIKLSRDVIIDARQVIRDYIEGVGARHTIQTMVRGHWKQQACGPGRTVRRMTHIEPYWRGPEDAPIGVRSHVLVTKCT